MAALLTYENLDDRREVARLLAGLSPMVRYRFVAWCCTGCRVGNHRPKWLLEPRDREAVRLANAGCDRADERITNQCYGVLWSLAAQYSLDLVRVTLTLEQLTRGRIRMGELERGACELAEPLAATKLKSSP